MPTPPLHHSGQQFFVPYNDKIADITETDTNKHTLNLATALGETRKIIAVLVSAVRISGTGDLECFPNEGTTYASLYVGTHDWRMVVIKDGTQRLQYKQYTANDDFDLYCLGYVVEA